MSPETWNDTEKLHGGYFLRSRIFSPSTANFFGKKLHMSLTEDFYSWRSLFCMKRLKSPKKSLKSKNKFPLNDMIMAYDHTWMEGSKVILRNSDVYGVPQCTTAVFLNAEGESERSSVLP